MSDNDVDQTHTHGSGCKCCCGGATIVHVHNHFHCGHGSGGSVVPGPSGGSGGALPQLPGPGTPTGIDTAYETAVGSMHDGLTGIGIGVGPSMAPLDHQLMPGTTDLVPATGSPKVLHVDVSEQIVGGKQIWTEIFYVESAQWNNWINGTNFRWDFQNATPAGPPGVGHYRATLQFEYKLAPNPPPSLPTTPAQYIKDNFGYYDPVTGNKTGHLYREVVPANQQHTDHYMLFDSYAEPTASNLVDFKRIASGQADHYTDINAFLAAMAAIPSYPSQFRYVKVTYSWVFVP